LPLEQTVITHPALRISKQCQQALIGDTFPESIQENVMTVSQT